MVPFNRANGTLQPCKWYPSTVQMVPFNRAKKNFARTGPGFEGGIFPNVLNVLNVLKCQGGILGPAWPWYNIRSKNYAEGIIPSLLAKYKRKGDRVNAAGNRIAPARGQPGTRGETTCINIISHRSGIIKDAAERNPR